MSDKFTPFIPSQTPKIRYGCHSDTDQKLNVKAYPTWRVAAGVFLETRSVLPQKSRAAFVACSKLQKISTQTQKSK